MLNKKGISPVVAIALLLIVSVVAVVGYQSWYQGYQSILTSDVEQKSTSPGGGIRVEYVSSDGILYVNNPGTQNVTMTRIDISGVDCSINQEIEPGITNISISSCLNNTGTNNVVIVTDSGIYEKKIFIEDVRVNSNIVTWLGDYLFRLPINITSSQFLLNYQVNLSIDTSTLISANKLKSDCSDLRFADSDKKTLLNYFVESGCNTASTIIWVKIPNLIVGENMIYLYYNDSSVLSESNSSSTLDYYDSFTSDTTANYVWTVGAASSYTYNAGKEAIEILANDNQAVEFYFDASLPSSGYIRMDIFKTGEYPSGPDTFIRLYNNSPSTYYTFRTLQDGASNEYVQKVVNGASEITAITTGPITDANNVAYLLEYWWNSTYIRMDVNGVNRKELYTTNAEVLNDIFRLYFYSSQFVIDLREILVTQYVPNSPTYIIGSEESKS